MKLYDLIPTQQNISEDLMSYSSQGEWMEKAVDTYNKKGIDPLLKYIADTKYNGKVDMTQFKHDFMSDRNDFKSQDEHVEWFLHFFDQLPEGKDKPKQNNPVAKHSRNMAGAGAHKSPKDYDRKNAKKDIKKELEEGEERSDIRDLMIVKVKDYLQTKSPGSYISLEDMESDLYDYASQLDHDDLDSPEELRDFMHNPGEEASSAVTELLSGMYHSEFDDYITSDQDYVDNRNMGHPDGYSSSEEDQPDRIREESNKMIGKPDNFYDAEERTEAYNDLQDALAQSNSTEAEYVKDGHCPECPNVEDDEDCYGFGNYGCDDGELTYNNEPVSWKAIKDHDERQADRKDQLANRPSDEELIPKVANMMKNMDDPRMAVRQVRIDYGYGPAKASDIVGKAFELLKQDEGLQFDEGTRCWKGYEKKGTKKMFGKTVPNCVKKENTGNPHKGKYVIKTDEPSRKNPDIVILPDEKAANDMVSSLSKKKPNVNYWVEIVEKIDKDTPCPACGDPKCDHKEDHINEKFKPHMMYHPKTGKGIMAKKEEDHLRLADKGYVHSKEEVKESALDGYYLAHRAKKLWLGDNPGKTERDYWQAGVKVQDEYTEKAGGIKGEYQGKGVSNWTVEEQVPYLQRPNSGYSKAIADYLRLNPGKSEDDFKELLPNQQEKYLNKYVEGKSPHKKGTAKYKKHMAAMHAEDVGADSSEADVSKMLAKALGDPNKWTEMSAPELYAELESRDTEFADAIKQVAKIVYGVKLEESK